MVVLSFVFGLCKTLNKRSLEQGTNGTTLRMTLRITVGTFAEEN